MIADIIILLVAGTAFLVWIASLVLTQVLKPDPAAELEQLEQYSGWLKDCLRQAEAQNHDADTKARILEELHRTEWRFKIVRAQLNPNERVTQQP